MLARLYNVTRKLSDDKLLLTFEVAGEPAMLESFSGKDLDLSIKEWRKKRSLDANSYFWVLLNKLSL